MLNGTPCVAWVCTYCVLLRIFWLCYAVKLHYLFSFIRFKKKKHGKVVPRRVFFLIRPNTTIKQIRNTVSAASDDQLQCRRAHMLHGPLPQGEVGVSFDVCNITAGKRNNIQSTSKARKGEVAETPRKRAQ